MSLYQAFAEAFGYPAPGKLERLESLFEAVPQGEAREALKTFLTQAGSWSLGEWEELYTRTWDLSPLAPPYLGFQIWGEDYRRGKFMAALQQAFRECQIDPGTELPDHLAPVLSYLDIAPHPLPELVEIFEPALARMAATLEKREAGNPYLTLLRGLANGVQVA